MTVIGLKRILFPLNDENLLPNAAGAMKPSEGRYTVVSKTKKLTDSLANLGILVSATNKQKTRRDKRQRDNKSKSNTTTTNEKTRDSPPKIISVPYPRCTSIPMDSLASLGNHSSLVPKTVSPPSTELTNRKSKTKKVLAKRKGKKMKRSQGIQVRKNTRTYLKGLTGKHSITGGLMGFVDRGEVKTCRGKSCKAAVSQQSTGLGAMFGIPVVPKKIDNEEATEIVDDEARTSQHNQIQPACAVEVLIPPEIDSTSNHRPQNAEPNFPEDIEDSRNLLYSPKWSVGTRVRKKFEGKGWFYGQMESFDATAGLYFIAYNDGDGEEFDEQDMRRHVLTKKKGDNAHTAGRDLELDDDSSASHQAPIVIPMGPRTEHSRGDQQLACNAQSSKETVETMRRSKRQRQTSIESGAAAPVGHSEENTSSPLDEKGRTIVPTTNDSLTRIESSEEELQALEISPPLRRSKRRRSTDTSTTTKLVNDCTAAKETDCLDDSSPKSGKARRGRRGRPTKSSPRITKAKSKEEINIDDSSINVNASQNRRSKRQALPPNRLGSFVSEVTETPWEKAKRSQPKRATSTEDESQAEVLLSSRNENEEPPSNDSNLDMDVEGWTPEELCFLRKAHQEVDPKSTEFWDAVAEWVGSKSAEECRERWFSFAKTPAVPTRKPKAPHAKETSPTNNDDDIFNATPMKGLFHLPDVVFGSALKLGIGSAIKVTNGSSAEPSNPFPKGTTHGYKTYIKNVKRDVNKSSKWKPPKASKPKNKKSLAFKDTEGDIEVKGRLSPGGTLRVNAESIVAEEIIAEDEMFLPSEDEEGGI